MANAVKSSPAMRLSEDLLQTISGFTNRYDCPQTMLVCKAWSRIFTPYNTMQYSGEMLVEWLEQTCPPSDRPDRFHNGVPYDLEHANLRLIAAYEIIANAEQRAFSSLHLTLPLPEHAQRVTQLFNAKAFSALTDLYVSVQSRELLRSIREGSPQLTSINIGGYREIGAKALCEELNACENLTETTIYAPQSDDDLQTLQNLKSLTRLQIDNMGRGTTPEGLRHLADGYPSLRMLCVSGGRAGRQPILLARPWVLRLVELESVAFRLLGLRLGDLTKTESLCVATQFLSKASKLQALEFQSCDLDPKCMEQLPKCPSLTDLSLTCSNAGITEDTIQRIAQCANLQFLSLEIPSDVDLEKALQHLVGHKSIEDLTLERDALRFSPEDELLKASSRQLVSVAQQMPALRVLELPHPLHRYVVKQLPQHNVYITKGPSRDKYKLLPEKAESKRDDNK